MRVGMGDTQRRRHLAQRVHSHLRQQQSGKLEGVIARPAQLDAARGQRLEVELDRMAHHRQVANEAQHLRGQRVDQRRALHLFLADAG